MATYYVQFASQDEPGRWHTVARVEDRALAQEMARLAARSFVTAAKNVGRAVSRSALKREGALHHAEWELGCGKYRGEAIHPLEIVGFCVPVGDDEKPDLQAF